MLDVLDDDDLRADFVAECEHLLLFDSMYDQIIRNLDSIAEEAESTPGALETLVSALLDTRVEEARRGDARAGTGVAASARPRMRGSRSSRGILAVLELPRSTDFFRAVEEWKKSTFPVPVRHAVRRGHASCSSACSSRILQSEQDRRRYDGRISPRNIGRRKDFWNRLTIAYRDLRIQELLEAVQERGGTGYRRFIAHYFDDSRSCTAIC